MSQSGNQLTPEPSHTNVGKATGKAGAYGGSELGSRLGGAVGPPIIGGIIGNLVGEKVGEKAIHKTGIDEKVMLQCHHLVTAIVKPAYAVHV